MKNHIHRHSDFLDVADRSGRSFYVMKYLLYFFSKEALNTTNPKVLTKMEIHVGTNYTSKAYLSVSLRLICNHSVYGKLI